MANTNNIIQHAEKRCQQNGSRLTAKRKQVLAGLVDANAALSAYELADYCQKHYGQSLPAMSVYRILEFLEQENLVHKLKLANKYVACSHITCEHEHQIPQFLICSNCQRVEEITINKSVIEELQSNVTKAGFELTTPQLEMNCLCQSCQTN